MNQPLPPCRLCGGALQRIASRPGHVVCGSGHLFTEKESRDAGGASASGSAQLKRVGEEQGGTGSSSRG